MNTFPTLINQRKPELVIFDLYGTLVKFGVMHHPFRRLMKWARVNPNDARTLMTINKDLTGLANHLEIDAPLTLLEELTANIEAELAELSLFDDVALVLVALEHMQIPVAICSNLAQPYGAIVKTLLSDFALQLFLSYEIGHIKPEPEIYDLICRSNNISPSSCLFIGDTYIADFEGPRKMGLQARHLVRGHKAGNYVIGSLLDILPICKKT
jgi:HAD superfamily hydrolase (TIGR01549 family)